MNGWRKNPNGEFFGLSPNILWPVIYIHIYLFLCLSFGNIAFTSSYLDICGVNFLLHKALAHQLPTQPVLNMVPLRKYTYYKKRLFPG